MNNFTYIILLILISTLQLNAAEKNDCSKFKKLSKEYISCKSKYIKSGIENKFSGSNNPINNIIKYQKKAWSEATN